jgi:tetratricopeptide (TPR) repeat protein
MTITRTSRALVLLFIGLAAVVPAIAADDSLDRAKGLYASAAYDEALAELDRLESAGAIEDHTSVAEYRVFCLLALNRRDEARRNIDRLLHDNPHYFPSPDRTSPRIQSVFRDVRRETLPKIVMERYGAAKAAFERKDPAAAQQFDELIVLLNDPDLQPSTTLKDLKEVAAAFRDLTKALAATAPSAAQDTRASLQPPAGGRPPVADIVYTSADTDVTPPVAQSQRIPPWRPSSPRESGQEFRGALRLLIDQSGAVVSATMPSSARPAYDQLLLRAAREWKFTPAQKDGVPVRYLKLIEVRLRAGAQ